MTMYTAFTRGEFRKFESLSGYVGQMTCLRVSLDETNIFMYVIMNCILRHTESKLLWAAP
jgi:hypothetical protein